MIKALAYFLNDKTREIYAIVNGKPVTCCRIREGISLPSMEKIRALHESMGHPGVKNDAE